MRFCRVRNLILLRFAPLRVCSATGCQQPPEWSVLGQVDCEKSAALKPVGACAWVRARCSVEGGLEAGHPGSAGDVRRLRRDAVQRSLDVRKVRLCRLRRLLPRQARSAAIDGASSRVRRVADVQRQPAGARAGLADEHADRPQRR